MASHFPLVPGMFMAIQMENNFPIIDIADRTPHIPESCQRALFQHNHDELTLEMVRDDDEGCRRHDTFFSLCRLSCANRGFADSGGRRARPGTLGRTVVQRDVSSFLGAYLDQIKGAGLVPENAAELDTLLACVLMDKAVYELGYELNNRPEWISIPIRGIRYLLESTERIRKGSEKES
jgi:hypothetical protein